MNAKRAARGVMDSIINAAPFNTAFLFQEPGCEAVGQGTPLAKAIEQAMERRFRLWEASWIRPKLEEIIRDRTTDELLEALKATAAFWNRRKAELDYLSPEAQEVLDLVEAAIAKAEAK